MTACFKPTDSVGQIARTHPSAIPVFERFGIDFCCSGGAPLAAACEKAGATLDAVQDALRQATTRMVDRKERDWSSASMTELADHIESTHHEFVRRTLSALDTLVPRVAETHGATDPRLRELTLLYRSFAEDMIEHMVREERVLFPWLRRLDRHTEIHTGPPWSVRRPISCMEHDHDDAGDALRRMRELTDGFAVPTHACGSYRAMLETLAALEADTHVHIHLENNILFPAGVVAEESRAAYAGAPSR